MFYPLTLAGRVGPWNAFQNRELFLQTSRYIFVHLKSFIGKKNPENIEQKLTSIDIELKSKLFPNLNGHFLGNGINYPAANRRGIILQIRFSIVYLRELKILKFIYELCFSTPRIPHHDNWYFRIFITIVVLPHLVVQIFGSNYFTKYKL